MAVGEKTKPLDLDFGWFIILADIVLADILLAGPRCVWGEEMPSKPLLPSLSCTYGRESRASCSQAATAISLDFAVHKRVSVRALCLCADKQRRLLVVILPCVYDSRAQ